MSSTNEINYKELYEELKRVNELMAELIISNGLHYDLPELFDIEAIEEDEKNDPTNEYRRDIESRCPEGYITIWNTYNYEYKKQNKIEV